MTTATQKAEKLQAILKLVDESITKADFVASFANVVKLVQQMRGQNEQEIKAMQENIRLLGEKLASTNNENLSTLKIEASQALKDLSDKIDAKLALIQSGEDGEDGQDGKDADEEAVIKTVLSQIPAPNLDAFRQEFLDAINEMKQEIRRIPEKAGGVTVFGPGKTRFVKYDISDQLDGIKKTFTLGTHFGIHSVQSSSSPFGAWREGIDYNEVGKTIVFTDIVDPAVYLPAGQSMIIKVLR